MPTKRKPRPALDDPTPQLVDAYIEKFRASERYYLADQAILALFQWIPRNEDLGHILLKLSVINDYYSTGILATFEMARHIQDLAIDAKLSARSTQVVNEIASFTVSGRRIYFFSFATKYCNWHDQDAYPIFDSFVRKVLLAYRHRDGFAQFTDADLLDYAAFKAVLESFKDHYGLQNYGFKRLDKFLWLYGKDLFPAKYKKPTHPNSAQVP